MEKSVVAALSSLESKLKSEREKAIENFVLEQVQQRWNKVQTEKQSEVTALENKKQTLLKEIETYEKNPIHAKLRGLEEEEKKQRAELEAFNTRFRKMRGVENARIETLQEKLRGLSKEVESKCLQSTPGVWIIKHGDPQGGGYGECDHFLATSREQVEAYRKKHRYSYHGEVREFKIKDIRDFVEKEDD